MAKIGILGHGTVGSGVAELLLRNAEIISTRLGEDAKLAKICDLRTFNVKYSSLFTTDSKDVTQNEDIDIVIECMGGVKLAFEFVSDALRHGKHVVTSNKELIATKGTELLKLAQENNVNLMYEASVGGGIPIINPLRQCLCANNIEKIAGILNGTTNYILTRMKDGYTSFETALKEAMDLGYAEADPSADVKGWDARRKICILSHVAFGAELDDSLVMCEGIESITIEDMLYAKKMNSAIKLLAVAQKNGDKYYAHVSPAIVPASHMIASVEDVFNAILVRGDMVGDVMFYGPGAGSLPTASAVCADIMDCIRHKNEAKYSDINRMSVKAVDAGLANAKLFIRISGEWGGLEERHVKNMFPGVAIIRLYERPNEFAFVTEEAAYADHMSKIDKLKESVTVLQCLRTLY